MGKKVYGHSRDPRTGKVKAVDQTPSRAAKRVASVPHGDYARETLGARVVDRVLGKLGL